LWIRIAQWFMTSRSILRLRSGHLNS
jgi:hypothetical protein